MSINTNISPTVSGVYTPKDYTQQLNYMSENAANALQNAFKFGTKVYDYKLQRDQEKILRNENERQTRLKENIENDKVLLAKMEKELEQLKAGNDVELRQGIELMQQNNVPIMQSNLDNLDKTNWNWNWRDSND